MTSDQRCGGMYIGLQTDSGDTYWFTYTSNVLARRDYGGTVKDCGLRLRAGETTFDPTWELDIAARTGGASGVATLYGGGSTVWVRVLDESLTGGLPSPADYTSLDTAPAWSWYSLDPPSRWRSRRRELSALHHAT